MPLERPESPPGRASRHAGPAPEGQDRAVAASQAILPAEGGGGNQIIAAGPPNEDKAVAIARTVLRPTVQAAMTLKEYGKSYGDLELSGLIDALTAQTKAVTESDPVFLDTELS